MARLCWRFWKAKASSTRPRGCREAASQGIRGLRPFSSQDVCLTGVVVEALAGGLGEEEAEADFWPVGGTLAGGERE